MRTVPTSLLLLAAVVAACASSVPVVEPEGPPYMVVSGGPVQPPVALHRVIPDPPSDVRARGEVLLKTIVGLDGLARNIEVIRAPHPALGEAAIEAAKRWRFTPGTLRGEQVETIFFISMKF